MIPARKRRGTRHIKGKENARGPMRMVGSPEQGESKRKMDDTLKDAITAVRNYVGELTGKPASDTEIAAALKRYFVLNEICDTVKMDRENSHGRKGAETEAGVGKG